MTTDHPRRPASVRGEDGASLLIVMFIMLVVSVIVVSLLGLAFTGTRSVRDYQEERNLRYAADAGLERAVREVAGWHTLGQSAGGCAFNFPIESEYFDGMASQIRVTCEPYNGDTSAPDNDGGQRTRFVEFTAFCGTYTPPSGGNPPYCAAGGSGPAKILAKAKVRYDFDSSKQANARAVVPKVISWDIFPGENS